MAILLPALLTSWTKLTLCAAYPSSQISFLLGHCLAYDHVLCFQQINSIFLLHLRQVDLVVFDEEEWEKIKLLFESIECPFHFLFFSCSPTTTVAQTMARRTRLQRPTRAMPRRLPFCRDSRSFSQATQASHAQGGA